MQGLSAGVSGSKRRDQLERERLLLLSEHYFWTHTSSDKVAEALELPTSDVLARIGESDAFQAFLAQYSNEPGPALASAKLSGQESWEMEAARASEHVPEAMLTSSEQMEVDSDRMRAHQSLPDIVYETDAATLVHPDDIVFLSQLGPVPTASVVAKCAVKSTEMPERSMACHSYQEQIDDINARSSNMHNWMLRAQEQPLYGVVSDTSKFVSTKDWDTVRDELIRVRVMERIEELKEKGKWSFWQPRKHRAPPRGKAHWDYLLDEMAWMQADFAEERKLRVEMARLIASWVMDYHHAVDKSRYVVAARRYVLPDDFICRDVPQQHEEVLAETPTDTAGDIACADPDKVLFSSARPISRSSSSHVSIGNQQLLDGLSGDGGSVYLDASDLAAVPSAEHDRSDIVAERGEDADVPIAGGLVAEPLTKDAATPYLEAPHIESTLVDKEMGLPSTIESTDSAVKRPSAMLDKASAKSGAAAAYDDRVVPSESDAFASTLSIYQILAQIPQSEYIEDILGDSVYTLQSLNSLLPYRPAWDTAYCDILDASPVVPICKTMWPDFSFDDSDSSFAAADGLATTIDIHELFNLNGDDSIGRFAMDADSHSSRSIFTRNLLAPPLLPMFTQANKTPRNVHSAVGQPPADTPLQQATSEACPGQAVFEWSAERDKLLAKVVQQYTGNWALITETVNHALALYGSRALTARICYERWVAIKDEYSLDRNVVQTGFDEPDYGSRKLPNWSSQLSVQPAVASLSAMQLATQLVSHSETLRVVSDSKKKREAAAKPSSVPPREIKPLPADQKVATPAELTKLKFDNDRRLQQLFIEQRQATAAAAALAMQQQRALNPQLQQIQLSRQIGALQAMLTSGRGLQRPLTIAQSRVVQQQIQSLQAIQQQQQAQAQAQAQMQAQAQAQAQMQAQSQMQAQNGMAAQRPPQTMLQQQQQAQVQAQAQALQQQHLQMQLAHAVQQQAQLAAGQANGGQQQQLAGALQGNGAAGMRFTPEQVQQILQARAASGVRPNITPALAAVLNARAQMAGAGNNNGQLLGAGRPLNAAAAAAAAANMFPPQQRQMIMQQIVQQQQAQQQAQQQLAQQQQAQQQLAQQHHQHSAMSPPPQMQRPPASMPGMQQGVGAVSMSPQLGSSAMQQQVPGASPGTTETPAPLLHTSSAAQSEHNTPQLQPSAQIPGGGISVSAAGSPNVGITQVQAQAILAAQQAMQVKQMQMQQQQQLQQQQLLLQQQQQSPAGLNQPQFAQYLSSLYPHQLAQISNQQRMSLLALRQQQQQQQQQQQHQSHPPQQQQQQQQFPGQLSGPNALNQQAALQALQQGLLAGNGMNGLGGLNPAVSQQMFAAQLAQNMKNQQMLKAGQPQPQQPQPQPQRPQTQAGVNQMQLMRIRQAMQQQQQQQQQQAMGGGPQRMFSMPGSQTASSPVMMSPPGPVSVPLPGGPIPGSPAMSTPSLNGFQMSPPMQAQQPNALHQTSMSPTMNHQQVMMSPQMHAQSRPLPPPPPPLGHLQVPGQQRPVQQQQQPHALGGSPVAGMQATTQQAMMLAAAQAAGLSTSAAQALIAQIAANAELNQSLAVPSTSSSSLHMSPPPPPQTLGEQSVSPSHAQSRSVAGSGTPGQGSMSPSNGGSVTPAGTPLVQTPQSGDSSAVQPTQQQQQRPPVNAPSTPGKQPQPQPHVRPIRQPVRPGVRPSQVRPPPPHQGRAGTTPPGARPMPRPMALSPATQQQQQQQQQRPSTPTGGSGPHSQQQQQQQQQRRPPLPLARGNATTPVSGSSTPNPTRQQQQQQQPSNLMSQSASAEEEDNDEDDDDDDDGDGGDDEDDDEDVVGSDDSS